MKRRAVIGAALVAVGLIACSPSRPTESGGFELRAPAEMAPGTSAQLKARTVTSGNVTKDVTGLVEWRSSNPPVLTVTADGLATAIAPGEAEIIARYLRRSSTARTFVLPTDTFRLTGRVVNESGAGVGGATITILSGTGAGLTATTDSAGSYALYGIRGALRIEIKRSGYRREIADIDVSAHRTFDLRLAAEGTVRSVEGTYSLTVAAESCDPIPPGAPRRRTYLATVTQTGERLDVVLSGADFLIVNGRGDRFSGRIDPDDAVTFQIGRHDGSFYYFYTAEWDVMERLANEVLVIHGSVVATPTSAGIFGTLAGAINVAWGTTAPQGFSTYCRGRHRFEMVKHSERR
jgi:hypothetical protein